MRSRLFFRYSAWYFFKSDVFLSHPTGFVLPLLRAYSLIHSRQYDCKPSSLAAFFPKSDSFFSKLHFEQCFITNLYWFNSVCTLHQVKKTVNLLLIWGDTWWRPPKPTTKDPTPRTKACVPHRGGRQSSPSHTQQTAGSAPFHPVPNLPQTPFAAPQSNAPFSGQQLKPDTCFPLTGNILSNLRRVAQLVGRSPTDFQE